MDSGWRHARKIKPSPSGAVAKKDYHLSPYAIRPLSLPSSGYRNQTTSCPPPCQMKIAQFADGTLSLDNCSLSMQGTCPLYSPLQPFPTAKPSYRDARTALFANGMHDLVPCFLGVPTKSDLNGYLLSGSYPTEPSLRHATPAETLKLWRLPRENTWPRCKPPPVLRPFRSARTGPSSSHLILMGVTTTGMKDMTLWYLYHQTLLRGRTSHSLQTLKGGSLRHTANVRLRDVCLWPRRIYGGRIGLHRLRL
jgi:hypothetical protein